MTSSTAPTIISFFTRNTPYEADCARMKETVRRAGYEVRLTPVDSAGSWAANCAQKARLCLAQLRELDRPLLFLDADCTLMGRLASLENPPFDLGVCVSRAEDIPFGTYAVRYRRFAAEHAGMWNSGVIYMRPTPSVLAVMERWAEACEAQPQTWDQIHLQEAWRVAGNGLGAAELAEDCRVGGPFIKHRSGHHAHMPERQRWLLLGSGPQVQDWWDEHGADYLRAGFMVCAINHAWVVPGADLHSWFRPDDFTDSAPPETWLHDNAAEGWKVHPYWNKRGRTTFVDVAMHILNVFAIRGQKFDLAVAGSDFIYPADNGEQSHFYGHGTHDPLRYGTEWLKSALSLIAKNYAAEKCGLFNVGGIRHSLLPFQRMTLTDGELIEELAPVNEIEAVA